MSQPANNEKGSAPLDGKETARQLYGGPTEARAGDAAKEPPSAEEAAEDAAVDYFRYLRRRFGEDVPEPEIEAFLNGFCAGSKYPDATEPFLTGYRAGRDWKQRDRRGGDGR